MSNKFSTAEEFEYSVVDLSTDSTTVYGYPAILRQVYVNTVVSLDTIIKDDTTSVFTIPANTPAGSVIPLGDTVFKTSLVVDPDNAATGSITVTYKPADLG